MQYYSFFSWTCLRASLTLEIPDHPSYIDMMYRDASYLLFELMIAFLKVTQNLFMSAPVYDV